MKCVRRSRWGGSCAIERLEFRRLLSTYLVSNTSDSGPGSLRQAIDQANANPGPDTITFAAGMSGTIALTSGQLEISDVTGGLTLIGPGAGSLSVSGNSAGRVFQIDLGAAADISGLTITGGFPGVGPAEGGGIFEDGDLTLTRCVVSGNYAPQGGGIFNSSAATLKLVDSTVANNQASDGGGAYIKGGLFATRCTFWGNTASEFGGAVFNQGNATLEDSTLSRNVALQGGAIFDKAHATALNCTISANSARTGGGMYGDTGGLLFMGNTILAGNTGTSGGPDAWTAAPVGSLGHNLIGITDGSTGWVKSDLSGTASSPLDPRLSPLAGNGGPTRTMALLPDSPAIDAGDNGIAQGAGLVTDQRGFSRVYNGSVDIGAYEFDSALPGDANKDGKVDFADLVILARHYGSANATWADGDFDGDHKVDFADLVILARNYGSSVTTTSNAGAAIVNREFLPQRVSPGG